MGLHFFVEDTDSLATDGFVKAAHEGHDVVDVKVVIGPQNGRPSTGEKCVDPFFKIEHCDSDGGNLGKRVNTDTPGDTFRITVKNDGQQVCAARTDGDNGGAGWGMNLVVYCRGSDVTKVWFGASDGPEKCVQARDGITCASDAGDLYKRINPDTPSDTFAITVKGSQVCARRTDKSEAWGMWLEIGCKLPPLPTPLDWSLCTATSHSNLGGMGPDSGDEEIRYSNIATIRSGSIDLVITNTTEYSTYSPARNGLKDCFGIINVLSSSAVTLSFRFVKSGTNDPVDPILPWVTVYDIDKSSRGVREDVTFETVVERYWLAPDSELTTSGNVSSGLTFSSTEIGIGKDKPSDPKVLTQEQRARLVTVEFASASEYVLTFRAAAEQESDESGGRNFMFGGKSVLVDEADGDIPHLL